MSSPNTPIDVRGAAVLARIAALPDTEPRRPAAAWCADIFSWATSGKIGTANELSPSIAAMDDELSTAADAATAVAIGYEHREAVSAVVEELSAYVVLLLQHPHNDVFALTMARIGRALADLWTYQKKLTQYLHEALHANNNK